MSSCVVSRTAVATCQVAFQMLEVTKSVAFLGVQRVKRGCARLRREVQLGSRLFLSLDRGGCELAGSGRDSVCMWYVHAASADGEVRC